MVHNRKLLQQLLLLVDHHDQEPRISQSLRTTLSTTSHYTTPEPELLPPNNSSSSSSSTAVTGSPGLNRPLNTPFDSSMALTILVLLTALFFMAFFSGYIRRFSNDNAGISSSSNSNNNNLPSSSSSSSSSHNNTKRRGVDPAAVRALPIVAYGTHASHLIDCAICLAEFEGGEMVNMIPCCRQLFHSACIETWLASHVSCPLCRSTKLCGAQEVSLSSVNVIMQVENDEDLRGRSTLEESNTGTCEVLPVGLRRTRSCSSLGQRFVLQRSTSF